MMRQELLLLLGVGLTAYCISGFKWKSSSCDFLNHQSQCVWCQLEKDELDKKITYRPGEPRAPPDKPENVEVYMHFMENASKRLPLGLRLVISHPHTTLSLKAFLIDIDFRRTSRGPVVSHFPKLLAEFEVLHFDDKKILIDIPVTKVYEMEGFSNPYHWLDSSPWIHVCSLPHMEHDEAGNCYPIIDIQNLSALPELSESEKQENIQPSCKADRIDGNLSIPVSSEKFGKKATAAVVVCCVIFLVFLISSFAAFCLRNKLRDTRCVHIFEILRINYPPKDGRLSRSAVRTGTPPRRDSMHTDDRSQWGSGLRLNQMLSFTRSPQHFSNSENNLSGVSDSKSCLNSCSVLDEMNSQFGRLSYVANGQVYYMEDMG